MGFEDLVAVNKENVVFRDVTPCSMLNSYYNFGETSLFRYVARQLRCSIPKT